MRAERDIPMAVAVGCLVMLTSWIASTAGVATAAAAANSSSEADPTSPSDRTTDSQRPANSDETLRELLFPTSPPAVDSLSDLSDEEWAEILDEVLGDLLRTPERASSRSFYGTDGETAAVFLADPDINVPVAYVPVVMGWRVDRHYLDPRSDDDAPRKLALELRKFRPDQEANGWLDGHIAVALYNGGGNPDRVIHRGALLAYYLVRRVEGRWHVEFAYGID